MNKFTARTFTTTLMLILKTEHPDLFRENGALNETKAAKRFGIDQPTFRRWAKGGTPKPEYVTRMASLLSLTQAQMRGESPIERIEEKNQQQEVAEPKAEHQIKDLIQKVRKVPILSSVEAGNWKEIMEGQFNEWQEIAATVGDKSFALRVTGRSMQNPNGSPTVPDGSLVIVDPNISAISGNIVVAKLSSSNEAMIKKLVIDGPSVYLEPLNPDYKPILADSECIIIGVVKQVIIDL